MKYILIVFIILFLFFLGAIAHESDMSRNFKEHGDAKAWFFPIVERPHSPLNPTPKGDR